MVNAFTVFFWKHLTVTPCHRQAPTRFAPLILTLHIMTILTNVKNTIERQNYIFFSPPQRASKLVYHLMSTRDTVAKFRSKGSWTLFMITRFLVECYACNREAAMNEPRKSLAKKQRVLRHTSLTRYDLKAIAVRYVNTQTPPGGVWWYTSHTHQVC